MTTLVVIYGLPGAGKTTISKKIKERFGDAAERLFTRSYKVELKGDRSSNIYLDAKEDAYADLFDRTQEVLRATPLVLVEGTFTDVPGRTTGQEKLESYIDLAEKENYQLLLLGVSCGDKETIESRIILRESIESESGGSLKGYRRLVPFFNVNLNYKNNVLIDNTGDLSELDDFLEKNIYPKISDAINLNNPVAYKSEAVGPF